MRGGAFSNLAIEARPSNRASFTSEYAHDDLGLHPARGITS